MAEKSSRTKVKLKRGERTLSSRQWLDRQLNDPYVKREEFNRIANELNARKIIITGAGHFNTDAAYTEFPHLLNQLKQLMTINN